MSKYKVLAVSTKTYANNTKTMWEATLSGDDGQHDKVGLFEAVTVGQEIEGDFYTNDKGYPAFKQKKTSSYTNNGAPRAPFGARPEDPKKNKSIVWQGLAKVATEIVIHRDKFQSMKSAEVIEAIAKTTDALVAEHDKRMEAFSPVTPQIQPIAVQPTPVQPTNVSVENVGPEDLNGIDDNDFDAF